MSKAVAFSASAGAGLFAAIGFSHQSPDLELVRLTVFGAAAGALAAIDVREHRIPNRIVLPAAVVCALLGGPAVLRHGLPALVLVAGLLVVAFVQPGAFGMGDVKEALLIAFALGAVAAPALLFGLAFAALAGLTLTVRRGRAALSAALPLAPFLAAGAAVALLT